MKIFAAILAALVGALVPAAARADRADPALRVHLPRTLSVEIDQLQLGLITVIGAEDEDLAKQAAAIPMGRAPWSKEELAIDRPTILGRLAAHGIKADEVSLTGADKVVVTRNERVIRADDVVQAAEAFLETTRPGPKGASWRRSRPPEELRVPAGIKISLEPRLVPHATSGEARVEVAAMADGRQVAAASVLFRMSYPLRQLVATREFAKGEAVTPENTEIQTAMADRPQEADWAPAYGQLAVLPISAGAVIRPGMVRPAAPKVLVRRNENVVMRIVGDGFQITAIGQALADGSEGDYIKVRNIDSDRVIIARVAFDGTVEPVYERNR